MAVELRDTLQGRDKVRIAILIGLIFLATAISSGTALYLTYQLAFEGQALRLHDIVQSTHRLIQAEIAQEQRERPGSAVAAMTAASHAREILGISQAGSRGFGRTGEFTLARREGQAIEFLIQRRAGPGETPESVPWVSDRAEPMRLALEGKSGSVVAKDYLGREVLAAFEPLPATGWGLVAKIEIAEIREPFERVATLTVLLGLITALLSVFLFLRTSRPFVRRLLESEDPIRSSFRNQRTGMAIVETDGTVVEQNERFTQLFASPHHESLQSHIDTYLAQPNSTEDYSVEQLRPYIAVLESPGPHGAVRHIQVTLQPILKARNKRFDQLLVVADDITEELNAQRRIQQERETKELILECAGEGIYGVDTEGRITFVNKSATQMLGYEASELIGQRADALLHHTFASGASYPNKECPTAAAIRTGVITRVNNQVFWRKGRHHFSVEYVSTPILQDEKIVGAVVAFQDITARRETEKQLEYLAYHDPMTGLATRAALDREVSRILDNKEDIASREFSLLFIDVDRMKRINDSLGHSVGDRTLKMIALRLSRCVLFNETLVRHSGDEFAILINAQHSEAKAIALADQIFDEFAVPFRVNDQTFGVSVSLGLVTGGEHYRSANDLLRDADIATIESKRKGGGRLTRFTPEMGKIAYGKLEKESSVREALAEDRVDVFYQPIVDLETKRIVAMEALVRMYDRGGRLVFPDEFIPIAEESGLIIEMGNMIMRKACAQTKRWREHALCGADFQVSINVSPRQLLWPNFGQEVRKVLDEYQLPGSALKLEVTESLAISSPELADEILRDLRSLGASICMDDFGTGYSSMSYVHQLPINTLKIDKSFVIHGAQDASRWAIVQSIVSMCEVLQLNVIAEGIEDESTAENLRTLGCGFGQGYHFGRPQNADTTFELLASQQAVTSLAQNS